MKPATISENLQYSAKAYVSDWQSLDQGRLRLRRRRLLAGQPEHRAHLHGTRRAADRDRGAHHGAERSQLRAASIVSRAPTSTPSALTTQQYYSFFVQDQWKAADRLTINAGIRYEDQALVGTISELTTLDGETLDEFHLKNNWAPRLGVVYDVLGGGRSRLYANWGRFFARIPNDLAARALSADEGFTRGDYFDASLTRPIPERHGHAGAGRRAGDASLSSSQAAAPTSSTRKRSSPTRTSSSPATSGRPCRTPPSASATSTAASAACSRTSRRTPATACGLRG